MSIICMKLYIQRERKKLLYSKLTETYSCKKKRNIDSIYASQIR